MTSTPTPPGPELLDERSIGGILVHLLGLVTGFFGPILLYVVSDHEFTRSNARHVIDWYLSLFALMTVGLVTFFLGADEVTAGGETIEMSLLPAPLDVVFALVGFFLLIVLVIAVPLTFVYAIVATVKAIFGSVWTYPGSIDFVERYW